MIATLKSAASKAFLKLGYTVIPTWRLAHFPFGEHLRRILQTFEIDCVLDVGANTGQYRDFLRDQVGYEGKSFRSNRYRTLWKSCEAVLPRIVSGS